MGQDTASDIVAMLARLDERVAAVHELLIGQRAVKEWYTTAEVAAALGKAEYTVREWCRFRRVRAEKRACGRGRSREWVVSHEELARIRNEGLLPGSAQ